MRGRFFSSICTLVAAGTMSVAAAMTANAADLIAPGPYAAAGPDSICAENRNLRAIERRFKIQARRVHDMPNLRIEAITDFRENRFLPIDEELRAVDRLYCQATAQMSDGHSRKLWYLIEYGEGFAGAGLLFGDNVEFCISGLDRWNVYDGQCRVLR